jgi:predicted HTH domain antitoxin
MVKIKDTKSETLSFTLPKTLRLELSAIIETGYYDSVSEFLRDAMRNILLVRKDLRIAIASVLYKEGKVSFGKAVEIANINYEEMKNILLEKGVKRRSGIETKEELEASQEKFKNWKKS